MNGATDATTLTLAEIEDGLRRLSAQLAAGECDFLMLLAEFDHREGWGGWGMRSPAHWLSLHCGMQLSAARERVRVARALPRLPLVRQAFADGRLSYCKVRALTRVATPATESDLVEIALAATGAQVERVVKHWRTTLVAEMSASSQLRRCLRRREDLDGSIVYTVRLAPEDAAVVDAAIAAAQQVVLDEAGHTIETPEETGLAEALTDEPPVARARADAFLLLAESFIAPEAAGGHTPVEVVIYADAAALAPHVPQPAASISPEDGASVEQRSATKRPPGCRTDTGSPLPAATVMRLLCGASTRAMMNAAGNPLNLGRSARHATHRQRLALKARDGCCRFPGCTQTKRLIPHHVTWWSRGGDTDIDELVLVCPAHHRAVHEVGYTITPLGRGRFIFRRPDGRLLPETGPPVDLHHPSHALRPVDHTIVGPTWAGERLDIDQLVLALAANTINAAGHDLLAVAHEDRGAVLRESAGWPLDRNRPDTRVLSVA